MRSLSAQDRLDQVRAVSGQRWLLGALAIAGPLGACLAIGYASGGAAPAIVALLIVVAAWSAIKPDTYLPLVVATGVVWLWLVRVDDVTSAWSIGVAVGLLVSHASTALMATSPASATFDAVTMQRWLRRCLAVVLGAVVVWLLVVLFDRGELDANAVLSFVAITALVAAAAVIRRLSVAGGRQTR